MYAQDILCGISKSPFEIPHKISYPYIERYNFYTALEFYELLDLRAHTCFWNAPQYHTTAWYKKARNVSMIEHFIVRSRYLRQR